MLQVRARDAVGAGFHDLSGASVSAAKLQQFGDALMADAERRPAASSVFVDERADGPGVVRISETIGPRPSIAC
jgi:hypothetical protein